MGGAAAISTAASEQASPPVASNYAAKVGPLTNVEFGYHIDNWFSVRVGYVWNQNQIVTSVLADSSLSRRSAVQVQQSVGTELMVYFRKRKDWVRPYLSAGPAWVHFSSANRLGLRVAVGADLMSKSGWGFRYSFGEMMTGNPLAEQLTPRASGMLMNFQNLFGVVKTF